jgi:alkane 1-monooxygenase
MSRPTRTIPPLPVAAFALASLLPLPLLILGAATGGPALWAAFLYMAILTILIDQLIPLTAATPDGEEFPAADALLVGVALGAILALALTTWALTHADLSRPEQVALFLTTGFWLGQVAHPAAHELIHRPARALFRLGCLVYICLLFGQHTSSHRLVHHARVATTDDPNSARPGEGYYRFLLRAWVGSFVKGMQAETALRAGKGGLHPYAVYLTGAALALALAFTIGGLSGLLVWAGLALHAQSQILLSDYVQHYGLTRATRPDGKAEPVGLQHSWNTPHWFTSAVLLNAPRHSDHHLNPGRPYPALRLPDAAPCLPWPLPLACMIALVPPLWRRMIRPHLGRWRARQNEMQDTAP